MVTMVKDKLDFRAPFPKTPTPLVDGDMIYALEKAGECVCEAFGVTRAELRSRSRQRRFAYPRHALAALISFEYNESKLLLGTKSISSSVIGWYVAKDHSTVLNSKRAHNNMMSYEDRTYEPYFQKSKEAFLKYIKSIGGIDFLNKRISDIDLLIDVLSREKATIEERIKTINSIPNEDTEDLRTGSKL